VVGGMIERDTYELLSTRVKCTPRYTKNLCGTEPHVKKREGWEVRREYLQVRYGKEGGGEKRIWTHLSKRF